MACPPISDPEAEARAREEILSIQQEIGRLFSTGVPTARFDGMVDSAKMALREGAYTRAADEAFDASIELEAFKRDLASGSALLSEMRTAITKAAGLGIDTKQAAAHLETATSLLRKGAFSDIEALMGPDLQSFQETLWTSDAARDAILQAQQVLMRLFKAGTDTAAGEKGLARAREAMRDGRFAKALVLAHRANPDKVSLELERREVVALIAKLEGLLAEAQAKGLVVEGAARALKRARSALDDDLTTTAHHVAKAGIEDLERRVRSFDHATGLRQKAEELYGEIAAEAGRDPSTERCIQRTKDLLAAGRSEEAQLLASRLVERMAKQRGLIAEFNSRRGITDRYLRNLIALGTPTTGEVEGELLRSLTLHQSWLFREGLDRLDHAQTLLLDLLATDANMDGLEARIVVLLRDITNEGIREELASRVRRSRLMRGGSTRRDAYRSLEEAHHIAESSQAGQAAAPRTGADDATAAAAGMHTVTFPVARTGHLGQDTAPEGMGTTQARPSVTWPAAGDIGGGAGPAPTGPDVELEDLLREEPPLLKRLRSLSNDRLLLGLDTTELDMIDGDVRRLWDADDTASAEVLVEFASRTAAPNRLPYSHGIEVELALVYGDGSWVTGARVSQVVEDVVGEGIKRLRALVDQGRVPSYVAERIVDMRIAEPEKPKRGKVVQLDYLLDGRLTSTDVLGRDAHGVGTTYIIELVTPPCRFVEELLWWLACLQRICNEVLEAKHPGVRLISIGLNPAQPYSEGISFGDHHHIGFPDEPTKRAAYNMLRAHVPHLIALTANSPIYKGDIPSFRCDGEHPIQFVSRTDPLSIRLRQNIGQLGPVGSTYIPYLREGDGPAEFTSAVRKASATDARLVDIYPFTRFGTIEVRFFDAQLSIVDRVALALILQGICRWGARWAQGPGAGPEVGHQVLLENRDRAIQMGMLLGFQKDRDLYVKSPEFAALYQGAAEDPHQRVKRLHDAVMRMFENIWGELEAFVPGGPLGGVLDTYLVMVHGGSKRLVPPPITPGQFLLYQQSTSGKGIAGLIEYLDAQARECGRGLRHNPVTEALGTPMVPPAKASIGSGVTRRATEGEAPSGEAAVGTGTALAPVAEDRPGGGGTGPLLCRSCKTGVEWGNLFCPGCGGPISYSCPMCGAPIEPADRYCPVCGVPMPGNDAMISEGG